MATTDREVDWVHDEFIDEAEAAEVDHGAARNLFDLRTIIGALFTFYGLFLTIYGIFDSQADVQKAAGVRINLWTGLGMLALGLAFLTWMWLRPLTTEEIIEAQKEDPEEEEMAEELRVKREEAGAAPARPE
jgi:NADH:ubiquinone oxidoreductase subunit 5 (subunit L)/multisubunit Na+/H+ antiporter MnhA subunit